jgi:hypothetical protein
MSWASTGGQVTGATGAVGALDRGRATRHTVLTALVLLIGFSVVTLLSYLTAGPSGSVTAFTVMQSVLGLLVLTYLVRWRTVAALRAGVPALPWIAVAGLVAYVLTPSSWTGTALFWWQLLDPGPLAFALDLPVWMAAVALGVLWASTQQQLVRGPATPYG